MCERHSFQPVLIVPPVISEETTPPEGTDDVEEYFQEFYTSESEDSGSDIDDT